MMVPPDSFGLLNDELLVAAKPEIPKDHKPSSPKRNTKDDLIDKILGVCKEGGIELHESDTKLRRMNKGQLKRKLAEVTSEAVRNQMCESVKARPGSCDSALGLAALRMLHDLVAHSTESGANLILPRYGYEMAGFVDCLKEPSVREATDAAILEIANDSDMMGYVESPFVRLLIAWSGAAIKSLRKKQEELNNNNATSMGPD